jgi:hypothetical protein
MRLIRVRIQRIWHPDPGFWWPIFLFVPFFTSMLRKPLNPDQENLASRFGFLTTNNWKTLQLFLFLILYEGLPRYRRTLQPSKENIQEFNTSNFSLFYVGILPTWIRIRTGCLIHRPNGGWIQSWWVPIHVIEFFFKHCCWTETIFPLSDFWEGFGHGSGSRPY